MTVYDRVNTRCQAELGMPAHEALIHDPNAFDRIRDEEIANAANVIQGRFGTGAA